MNRRSKRSKRSKRNKRTKRSKMRGGGKISMVVRNVGTEDVSLSWRSSDTGKWNDSKNIASGVKWTVSTYIGHQWRVQGNGNELSWILADGLTWYTDIGAQEIHVDFTPSNCSLTWAQPTPDAASVGPAQKLLSRGKEEVRRAAASARTAPGHDPYTGPTDVGSAMDDNGY